MLPPKGFSFSIKIHYVSVPSRQPKEHRGTARCDPGALCVSLLPDIIFSISPSRLEQKAGSEPAEHFCSHTPPRQHLSSSTSPAAPQAQLQMGTSRSLPPLAWPKTKEKLGSSAPHCCETGGQLMAFTSLNLHVKPPLRTDFKCKDSAAHKHLALSVTQKWMPRAGSCTTPGEP